MVGWIWPAGESFLTPTLEINNASLKSRELDLSIN